METTNKGTNVPVTSNGKVQKVAIEVGKSNPIVLDEKPDFNPANFAQFLGALIDPENNTVLKSPLKGNAITFKVSDGTKNSLIVSIPSETVSNDRLSRVIKTVQNVAKQMFAGYMLEEETKNPVHIDILMSLNGVGLKFSTFTKVAVTKGVKAWSENKRLKVALLVEKSKQDNLIMIAENEVIRPIIKGIADTNKTKMISYTYNT